MRLDLLYMLGSLWRGEAGPQVCTTDFGISSGAALEVAWSLEAGSSSVTAFVDVNVIPMDTERVLTRQTVLVEGGKITALGPAAKIKVPVGAVQVDGRGKYLIPGLANMHEHGVNGLQGFKPAQVERIGKLMFQDYLVWGVTTIRPHEGPDIARLPEWKRHLAPYPMPRIYHGRYWSIYAHWSPDSAGAFVASAKAAGYDHISISGGDVSGKIPFKPEERVQFDSLLAATRRAGLPLTTHRHSLTLDEVLALGSTGGAADHPYVLADSVLGKSIDSIRALAGVIKRSGVWLVPTLFCLQGKSRFHELPALIKALQDAGAGLLLGNDGGNIHVELTAMVQGAGFTPYQALLTGTRNVAQYMGKLDEIGTIAVGKWADLVLLNSNPLADINNTRKLAGVMVAGQWHALDCAQLTYGC